MRVCGGGALQGGAGVVLLGGRSGSMVELEKRCFYCAKDILLHGSEFLRGKFVMTFSHSSSLILAWMMRKGCVAGDRDGKVISKNDPCGQWRRSVCHLVSGITASPSMQPTM